MYVGEILGQQWYLINDTHISVMIIAALFGMLVFVLLGEHMVERKYKKFFDNNPLSDKQYNTWLKEKQKYQD